MPDELAGRALLDGFRGGPVARPRPRSAEVLAALGDLLAANPASRRSRSTRCGSPPTALALDAVVTLAEPADAEGGRTMPDAPHHPSPRASSPGRRPRLPGVRRRAAGGGAARSAR